MKKVNEVFLFGSVGSTKLINGGNGKQSIFSMSMATNENWKDSSGQIQTQTNWHSCVCFGQFAELLYTKLVKGSMVVIIGKLQTRQYIDKDNQSRYVTEVLVTDYLLK